MGDIGISDEEEKSSDELDGSEEIRHIMITRSTISMFYFLGKEFVNKNFLQTIIIESEIFDGVM